ncbi:hypothetical protein A7P92_08785 [Eikenella corrodens]|nr:hypothetical protein A7P92_08730 [Eikenella corrodens]OAM22846.1 hypothetical protein A7P92_08785 [Eikenella corrodens]
MNLNSLLRMMANSLSMMMANSLRAKVRAIALQMATAKAAKAKATARAKARAMPKAKACLKVARAAVSLGTFVFPNLGMVWAGRAIFSYAIRTNAHKIKL